MSVIMKKIILASGSPRRREILEKTGLTFVVRESAYEEDMTLPLTPVELVKHLAAGKARAVVADEPDALIIAADTFIVFGDNVLGKPKTEERAREMLKMLSGKENQVVTGVAIIDTATGLEVVFHDIAKVFIKELSEATIEAYIKTGDPLDKAGAYAIQGIGAVLIEKIEGDFFAVMGLPISRLADELKQFGINIL